MSSFWSFTHTCTNTHAELGLSIKLEVCLCCVYQNAHVCLCLFRPQERRALMILLFRLLEQQNIPKESPCGSLRFFVHPEHCLTQRHTLTDAQTCKCCAKDKRPDALCISGHHQRPALQQNRETRQSNLSSPR